MLIFVYRMALSVLKYGSFSGWYYPGIIVTSNMSEKIVWYLKASG